MTAKVDGSLLIINIYPEKSEQYEIIKNLALKFDSEFTRDIVLFCIENHFPIITVSTQGTLFIGSEMEDYFLTAIQCLISMPIENKSDWNIVIPQFVSLCLEYYYSLNLDNDKMVNFCFEAYCKNRTTITSKLHTELAVGYDHNGFNLLGMMYDSKYIPHFDMPKKVFKQPFHIKINSTTQVFELMNKLDKIVLDQLTLKEFFNDYELDDFTSNVIHPEGFVMLTPDNKNYDYAKVKTHMYYKCHKVRHNNIKDLLLLPQSCEKYYPILKSLHMFFDNSDTTITNLIVQSYESLKQEVNYESELYKIQNPKGQTRWNDVIKLGIENSESSKIEVVFKMMLNTRNTEKIMTKIIGDITQKLYSSNSDNIVNYTKGLLMKVEPWKDNWQERLHNLFGSFDDSINQLYGIVIGFTD